MDGRKVAVEQTAANGNFCQLESDLAGRAHNTRPDLDQAGLKTGEGPVSDLFRQVRALEKDGKVIRRRMKLETYRVLAIPGHDRRVQLIACSPSLMYCPAMLRGRRQLTGVGRDSRLSLLLQSTRSIALKEALCIDAFCLQAD